MIGNLLLESTQIYFTFIIIVEVLFVCAIIACIFDIALILKKKKIAEGKADVPETLNIRSEDVTFRIKGSQISICEAPSVAEKVAEEAVEEPAEEPAEEVAEESAEAEAENAAEEEETAEPVEGLSLENAVILPKVEKRTFMEKYDSLDPAVKTLLDEFGAYVTEKENCSQVIQASALTYKYKKGQIAKAIIRRDTVVLNFAIHNPDFSRMVKEEKSSGLKVKPVEIRLTSEETLTVAKQTADLTVDYLKNEEEYRIEKRREARREAMRLKREQAAAEASATANETAEPAEPAEATDAE